MRDSEEESWTLLGEDRQSLTRCGPSGASRASTGGLYFARTEATEADSLCDRYLTGRDILPAPSPPPTGPWPNGCTGTTAWREAGLAIYPMIYSLAMTGASFR
jgi:hypothetical protein